MTKKCTLQNLLSDFKEHSSLSEEKQQEFVENFFGVIAAALQADKIVKVKGWGTFKIIDVNRRSSVDVNTGDRIEIGEHSRISFIPDAYVKSQINRPFEQFDTVVLDGDIEEPSVEGPTSPQQVSEAESCENMESENPTKENTDMSDFNKENTIMKDDEYCNEDESQQDSSSRWASVALKAFVVIVLMAVSYLAGVRHWFGGEPIYQQAEIAKQQPQEPQMPHASQISPKPQGTVKESKTGTTAQPAVKEEKPVSQRVDTVKFPSQKGDLFKIVGFKEHYVLAEGETLNKIAKKIYGNYKCAKYIVRYNDFPNPDLIPIGTKIRIPQLEPIE